MSHSAPSSLGGTGTPDPTVTTERTRRQSSRHRIRNLDPVLAGSVLVLVGLLALGVLGPLLWHGRPNDIDIMGLLQGPSATHPMGTDSAGRDVLARFIKGSQISLLLGLAVVVVAAFVGGLIGTLSGILGGWIDAVLMRIMDAILAFPALILAMAITVGFGAGLLTAALGVIVAAVPWYARVVRSEVLRVRTLAYVEAASAIGAPRRTIVLRHIVPHVLPTLVIQAAAAFGSAVLSLAALGFIGLGAQIPTPEWGAMITEGLQYALTGQWWVGVFPGLGLLFAVTAASVLSDKIRDRLDPRTEARRG